MTRKSNANLSDSGGSSSGEDSTARQTSDDEKFNNAGKAAFGELLSQILEATGADSAGRLREHSVTRELLKVAESLRSEPFSLDPVLIHMVRVFTKGFRGLTESQSAALERSVATSFYDDISSRERAEKLWGHLVRIATDAQ